MLNITITKTTNPKEKPGSNVALGFGNYFSDHMFLMDYTPEQGWHDARIVPYAPLTLDPSASVFHYGQAVFEGMKAYRTADGSIQLFRPDCNARRMRKSHIRMCIPEIPEEDFVQAVKALCEVEKDWTPHEEGSSLYFRPFTVATTAKLGVHASGNYTFWMVVFGIVCLILTIKPSNVIAVKTGKATGSGIECGDTLTTGLAFRPLGAFKGKDAEIVMSELGALVMDFQTLGDLAVEKWKK